MNERPDALDISGLLSIDVDSELRKLSGAQLQGIWQIPAEAVRRALRSGAQQVDVRLGRHRAAIVDDGTGIAGAPLRWTAILLDRQQGADARHAALTALESTGELVLLAIAGLPARTLRIESIYGGKRWVLEFAAGGAPSLASEPSNAASGCSITLHASALDRRQCAQWLEGAARFAPAAVRIDGKAISSGFEHVLASRSLQPPLRGRLALTPEGESAHVWLLEHGLVTGHLTLPDALPFEAAIELGSDALDLSAARVRESFAPHVDTLIDQAITLLVEAGRCGASMNEPARARVARLVLQAARKRLRLQQLASLPVFRVIERGTPRTIDLETLRSWTQRDPAGGHVLPALYPSQRPEHFALGTAPVLIADPVERSRLAELLNVKFRPPDPKEGSSSFRAALRRSTGRTARAFERGLDLLRHPIRRPPLADEALDRAELTFLRALRAGLAATVDGIDMCAGKGPIRYTPGPYPHVLLPRENAEVRASIAAYAKDRTWLYAGALTLLGGRALPPVSLREVWTRRRES